VKLVYARDPSVMKEINATAQDPLHLACLHGNAPAALYLIEKGLGLPPLRADDSGFTALVYASRWAHYDGGNLSMKEVVKKLRALSGL
jgi:hypothetical protein